MSINVGQVSTNLSDGNRFYAYSGVVTGDITVPASITLISIPNTGLRDSFVKIQPYQGTPVSTGVTHGLGIAVSIDGVQVYTDRFLHSAYASTPIDGHIELFIPRQSSLTILSLNSSTNNTQERGCNMLGWSL